MRSFSPRTLLLLQALASIMILGAALVSQYGFGLYPCHLCLLQRYPYAAVIAIGLLAAWRVRNLLWQRRIVILNVLIWLVGGAIAVYHAGVEKGIFPGPSACTSSGAADSLDALKASIMNAPLVSCDQAMAEFLGLSMAAWNAVAVFCLTIVTLLLLKRYYKEGLENA